MSAPRKLDTNTEKRLIAKYIDGASLLSLVEEFKVSPGTVRAIADRHGVPKRRVGRPNKIDA